MKNSTVGVFSTGENRSQRDMQLQSDFNCKRPNQSLPRTNGNGTGVLGSNISERTSRDKQLQNEFSCSNKRENYCSGSPGPSPHPNSDEMIYPRSVRDKAMLKEFNPGACQIQRELSRENYCGGGSPSVSGAPSGPWANLNYNPYNSSSNITYVSLR